MYIENAASLLAQASNVDPAALASIVTVLLGGATVVGVLITYILVKPMITTVKDEIFEKIDTMEKKLVSKEVFRAYINTGRFAASDEEGDD